MQLYSASLLRVAERRRMVLVMSACHRAGIHDLVQKGEIGRLSSCQPMVSPGRATLSGHNAQRHTAGWVAELSASEWYSATAIIIRRLDLER
jgi:hypothetical protein